jgi:uncharacterized LabA/DUF88 family protein
MGESSAIVNSLRFWMLFVGGENFTRRGQEVLKEAARPPKSSPWWRRDTFLWLPTEGARAAFFAPTMLRYSFRDQVAKVKEATRAYYYGSMPTGEPEWTQTRLALRELGFEPRLFPRRQGRSKAVDIVLTTEVLTLAVQKRYEVAVIIAGDGDYVPLIDAVKSLGVDVLVTFFESNGLSPELRIAADDFVDLTPILTNAWEVKFGTGEQLG